MKWKRTGQLHTAESVPILHLYQALQLQNNWGQKGSQENPQAQQKLSWRISWLCYKTITDQLKNPQIFLNDHTFIPELSALYLTEMDRCCIGFICVQLFWLICLLTLHKLKASLMLFFSLWFLHGYWSKGRKLSTSLQPWFNSDV